jgi:hypothetical protein
MELPAMTITTPNQRDFAFSFRKEFSYVEEKVHLPPLSPLCLVFYESVDFVPWERSCGYWNVFINFEAYWDIRDGYFTLRVRKNDRKAPSPGNESPVIKLDWILDVLNPGWRDDWPAVDPNDGLALVKLYAAAIKPYAREIFLPAIRPSEGLEGFSWWREVKPRVEAAQKRWRTKVES